MEQVKNVFYASPEEVTPKLIRQVVFHTMSQAASSDDNILASEYNILAVSGMNFLMDLQCPHIWIMEILRQGI